MKTWRVLLLGLGLSIASTWVTSSLAAGAPVTQATEEQRAAAQQAFTAALEKSRAGKHDEALAGFRASHEIVASPNSRIMIARELAALGRFGEAYREAVVAARLAEEAAAADPKYADAIKGAQEDLQEMKAKVGFVRLDLRGIADSEIVIAGRTVAREEKGEPIAVDPGEVEIIARSPRGQESRKVSVAAGAEASVTFVTEAQAPDPPDGGGKVEKSLHPFDMGDGQRITAAVVGGVGVVGMALFGVFGGLHLSKYNDLEDQCPGGQCPASLAGEADTGRSYQTGANVSLVIGLVGLVGGAALLIPTYVIERGPDGVGLELTVGPASASIGGTFQ